MKHSTSKEARRQTRRPIRAHRPPLLGIVLLAVVFGGGSCSTSAADPEVGSVARFKASAMPDFMDIPFPSDAYLVNGKIIDPLPNVERVVTKQSSYITHELGKTNGFSRIALSLF
jgi:hypothetical protein